MRGGSHDEDAHVLNRGHAGPYAHGDGQAGRRLRHPGAYLHPGRPRPRQGDSRAGDAGAVDDVAAHAVAFTPTIVSLREAMLVGDRIYLFVLITDSAGEEEFAVLKADSESSGSR